jgi:hypothetical protein
MSLAAFLNPNLRLQYRKRWSDPWLWDAGTAAVAGPWEHAGGNKTGSATFLSYDTEADNREVGAAACPLRRGWFVRICNRTRATNGTDPTKIYWTGFLAEEERVQMGGQPEWTLNPGARKSRIASVQWTALGLGGLLANIDLHRVWRGCGSSSAGLRALESIVRFGYEKRPDCENRGYARSLYAKRDASVWTLWDLLEGLLTWHLYDPNGASAAIPRFPHWPIFQIGGLTSALNWPVRDVTLGGNLFEAMAAILHPRRGLFFTAEPPTAVSGPVTLRVQTFAQAAVSIPLPEGGTQEIPANTLPVTLSADVPHRSLQWAPPPSPRRLTLHGHRDVRIISLRWSRTGGTEDGALARRWDTADDSKAGDTHIDYTHVYRTWSIRSGWDGTVKGTTSSVLPHRLSTFGSAGTPDPVHGAGGLSGGATTSGTDPFPEFGLEFIDQIPMPSQATNVSGEVKPISDWLSGASGITLDEHATPLRPMAWVHHRGANTWEKLNFEISFPDARTVRLGGGSKDAAKIKAKLSLADDDLVLTCAVLMPSAMAVSYIPDVAADADVQISADRAHTVSWAERIVVQAGTVFGLVTGAAPTAPTNDRTVRDDTGLLRSTLLLQRLGGERSAGAVYTDTAEIDTSIQPGQMVTQASVPGASGTYIPIGYVVTSVRYDPADGPQPKTIAQIDTAQVDLEAIA